MAGFQNFRSAFHGFNREDVVHYIEYMNHQHNEKVEQLNTQLQNAQEELQQLRVAPDTCALQAQLEEALEKIAALEAQIAQAPAAQANVQNSDELEAYRRAERAERLAQERAAQIYAQANAVLADATVKVEEAADGMNAMAQQVQQQLDASRQNLLEAVAAMYAIRPEN